MRKLFTGFALAVAVLTAVPASAQTPRERRPYRGLFGGGGGETEQMLAVSFSAATGYDDDVLLSQLGGAHPSGTSSSSVFGQVAGSLNYSMTKGRGSFGASIGTSGSHYPSLEKTNFNYYGGNMSGTYQLTSRTNAGAGLILTYQPLHFMTPMPILSDPLDPPPLSADILAPDSVMPDPLPVQPLATDPALSIAVNNYLTTEVSAGIQHAFMRRLSGSFSYSMREASSPNGEMYLSRSLGGGLNYGLGKGVNLRAGYTLSESRYGSAQAADPVRLHQVDGGIDFSHGLSLTRRTTLSFRTGTSVMADEFQTHFYITGNATLTHELGRTWFLTGAYNRDVSLNETFSTPVLYDSMNAGIGGLISRKLQLQSSVGATMGDVGFSTLENGFANYYAATSARYGLTRNIALEVSYTLYRYSYEAGVVLPEGVPRNTDRQSVRVSLSFWAPVFQRARRSNASR